MTGEGFLSYKRYPVVSPISSQHPAADGSQRPLIPKGHLASASPASRTKGNISLMQQIIFFKGFLFPVSADLLSFLESLEGKEGRKRKEERKGKKKSIPLAQDKKLLAPKDR